jgi:hypothetical protein
MKRKLKKKKPPKREEWTYVIEIKDWDFSYMFSINKMRDRIEGPFWEHTDLEVKGRLSHPENLKDKEIDVTVMATRRDARIMNKPEDYDQCEPKAVGTLTIRGKYSELLCWVPFDAFQMLCSMLNAGKIKYLILYGAALYRGDAAIRSMTFQEHYDTEEVG